MSLLDIVVFVVIMQYTYVELMSMGQQQKPKPWRRNAPLSRSVTSNVSIEVSYFNEYMH